MRRALLLTLALLLLLSTTVVAEELPDIKNGALTIPWSDFKAILEKLQTPPTTDDPPPIDFALGRGTLSGVLADGEFELTASYPLSILRKGWVIVPLVDTGAPIEDVRLDNQIAPITDHDGEIALIIKGPSTHTVSMRFRLAASMRPGPGALDLELPAAAGQVLTLKAGDKYSGLTVDGATMSQPKNGPLMAIMTGDSLNLSYTVAMEKKEELHEKLPPKVLVENSTLVSIDEGFIRAVVQLAYEVRHAPVSEFKVIVPAGFDVADCGGASLVGWKMDEQTRLLTATVGFEVKGEYNLTLVLERSTKDESFTFPLPAIQAQEVERERGFFAVQVTGGVEVTPVGEVQGLQMVDAKELPAGLRGGSTNPIVLSFKYLRHPFSADLNVVRHKTQAVLGAAIDSANYVVQLTEDGDCVARALYSMRNNRKQFLEITLPPGDKIALWSTFVAGKPVKPSQTKEGKILLPLEKSSMVGSDLNSFEVEVIYYFSLGENVRGLGALALVMPEVDLPISRSMLTVFAPARYRYTRWGGTLREPYVEPVTGTLMDKFAGEAEPSIMPGEPPMAPPPPAPMMEREKRKAGVLGLMEKQEQAEQVFQTRIRAAQQSVDATGSLPARFAVPNEGSRLRFEELITLGEPSTLRLFYTSRRLSGTLNYLVLLIVAAMVWFAARLVRRDNGGRKWLIAGTAVVIVLVALGVSIGNAVAGAALTLLVRFVQWVIVMIRTHS